MAALRVCSQRRQVHVQPVCNAQRSAVLCRNVQSRWYVKRDSNLIKTRLLLFVPECRHTRAISDSPAGAEAQPESRRVPVRLPQCRRTDRCTTPRRQLQYDSQQESEHTEEDTQGGESDEDGNFDGEDCLLPGLPNPTRRKNMLWLTIATFANEREAIEKVSTMASAQNHSPLARLQSLHGWKRR